MERVQQMQGRVQKKQVRKWKRTAGLLAVGLLLSVGVAIAAITATVHNVAGYQGDVYSFDESTFAVTPGGMVLSPLGASAAGDTQGGAIEMALVPGSATEAMSIGDWGYVVTVAEVGINTLTAGDYEAKLFLDGVDQGSLFLSQDSADAIAVESVTMTWNLGSSLPGAGSYVVQIEAL